MLHQTWKRVRRRPELHRAFMIAATDYFAPALAEREILDELRRLCVAERQQHWLIVCAVGCSQRQGIQEKSEQMRMAKLQMI